MSFGNNKITEDEKKKEAKIFLVNGGEWIFDYRELIQLNEQLYKVESSFMPIQKKVWRTSGNGAVIVERELGEQIFLREGASREGYFLYREIGALHDDIHKIIPCKGGPYSFGGNTISLYRKEYRKDKDGKQEKEDFYAINLVHEGVWIFDSKEINNFRSLLGKFTPNGKIGKTTIEYTFLRVNLVEPNHQGYFWDTEKESFLTQLRILQTN